MALAAWAVLFALVVLVIARVFAWDRIQIFAQFDAATEVAYLPAWLVLVGAAIGRRRLLGLLAAALCLVQIVYVAPELLAARPVPAGLRDAPTLRLLDANVQDNNHSMSGYIRQIHLEHPDVVALEETAPGDEGAFLRAGAFTNLPYRFFLGCCGSRGFIVASRYPLGRVTVSSVDGLAYLLRASLQLPERRIDFWVVHTTAPTMPGVGPWNAELDGVLAALRRYRPRPLLMAGDFNASWGNRGFRAILATGLVDAAAALGEPFAFTWSERLGPLPPLIRIDHVLTGGNLAVTALVTQDGRGSEHRDLLATVAVGASGSRSHRNKPIPVVEGL